LFGANQRFVRIGCTTKREDFHDPSGDGFPQSGRENEEESNVGEKGDDKNIDKEDASGKGERPNEEAVRVDLVEGLRDGTTPDLLQCDLTTDEDPQVCAGIFEGKVRPGGGGELGTDKGPKVRVTSGDSSRLIFVDAKT
jgi:hypothetical protein